MNAAKQRLRALDAFRGLTIAMMILVNTPGSWAHVYAPLRHSKWHGCTPTDLVFPFFLFIVGVAMSFSFKKFNHQLTPDLAKKILGRTITIFLVGTALTAFPFIRQDWDWSHFRVVGVLHRIALAYGISAFLVLKFDQRKILITSGSILVFYWLAMWLMGGNDPFSLENNFARRVDIFLLGANHLYGGFGIPFDPEGLLSTLPAIVTPMIGYQIGMVIQSKEDKRQILLPMLKIGAILTVAGFLWGLVFPINKPIWTSSYVLYTAGLATLFLTLFIWLIDIKKISKWAWPMEIFGTNSIFVFAFSGLWVKTIIQIKYDLNGELVNGYTYLYQTVFVPMAGNLNGSLLFALFHVFMWWIILYELHRRKIFITI